ncbi:Sulfate transporter 4.1 [Durusdinium trenchii]|uniref:Chloroplastic (AST82) n=1 Tax=Durusdinium trenchii TaxID=1381693 RepID=A0ABP0K064_9DINO
MTRPGTPPLVVLQGNAQESHDHPLTPLLKIETERDFSRSFAEKQEAKPRWPAARSLVTCGGKQQGCRETTWNLIKQTFPVVEWLPKYDFRGSLLRDVLVGVTLGFVIAPKAMAHALLAELSPIHGIYTAFFSTLVYGSMGMSKWLSLGTCALPALLFGEALLATNLETQEELDQVGSMLTLYIGIWTFVMLALRLDKLVVLIPPAVLAAFTTTAAFLIGTTQVKYLLGVSVKASGFVQTYVEIFKHISETNVATVIFSGICMTVLVLSKKATARWGRRRGIPDPGAMVAVLLSIGAEALFKLEENYGIEVAGTTPSGMPPFKLPWVHISDGSIHSMFAFEGLIIAVLNFVLAVAIAKNFARRSKSELRVSQELKALGAVNAVGSFFGAQVAGGSFSGSAIIASLQATSMLHNFVNSFVMMLILVVLTPMIELLPKATLACIIIAALPTLVNFERPKELAAVKTDDFVLWVGTFLITLFGGVQWGIICGAALALAALIRRNIGSDCTELGVLPGTTIYRSLERFPDAERIDGISMYRLDASLSFANFERFSELLEAAIADVVAKRAARDSAPVSGDLDTIILSCEAVNDIDTAAIDMLCRFAAACEKNEIRLLFSGWKSPVRRTLYAANRQFMRSASGSAVAVQASQKNGAQAEPVESASSSCDSTSLKEDKPSLDVPASPSSPATKPSIVDLEMGNLGGEDDTESVSQEVTVQIPAPLDPEQWFLNLHDAVIRSLEGSDGRSFESSLSATSSSAFSGPQGSPSGAGEVFGAGGELTLTLGADAFGEIVRTPSPSRRGVDTETVEWPKMSAQHQQQSDRKKRTNSTPMTSTTEVSPNGEVHSWNYASNKQLDQKEAKK